MKGNLKKYIKEIFNALKRREMAILPGNLSFFLVLSLIPLITLLVYFASLFSISIENVIVLLNKVLPEDFAIIVADIISGKGFDGSVGTFVIIAIMVATNGTYALIKVSNSLYNFDDAQELKDRIKALMILFVIIMLFLFLLIVPIFGNQILGIIKNVDGLSKLISNIEFIFNIIKWPFTFLIIYFNVKLIYCMSPSHKIKSYTTTYGALLTTILWIVATYIFSYYLKHFARYDILYDNLSSIIILMIWIYMLCYIFVLGIAINSTRYHNILKNDNTNEWIHK